MKVGLVSEFYYPWPGGISEHVYNLARELRTRGHEIKILTGDFDGRFTRWQAKLPFFSVGRSHLDTQAPNESQVIRFGKSVAFPYNGSVTVVTVGNRLGRKFDEVLRREAFDLLHVHDPLAPTLPMLAVSQARCPVVGTLHAYHQNGNRLLSLFRGALRKRMEKISALVAVSHSAQAAFERYFTGLDYRVIPNGVSIDRFKANGSALAGRYGPTKKNILYVGQFVKKKGFGMLLEAFKILSQHRGDIRLIAVGDGPLEGSYRRQNVREVHFLGHRRGKALAACYDVADIFVAPSIGFESFGIILLEAMAAGVPIVASDIPGFRNVVGEDQEAVLVPPGNPELLARGIERVLDDEVLRNSLQLTGSKTVQGYAWSRVVDDIELVYADALGETRPSREPAMAAR